MAPSPQQPASPLPTDIHIKLPMVSHQAIVWVVLVGFITIAIFTVAMWLLCGCRMRRSQTMQYLDNRGDFYPWNPNAPRDPGDKHDGDSGGPSLEMTPLARVAIRSADFDETAQMSYRKDAQRSTEVDEGQFWPTAPGPAKSNPRQKRYYRRLLVQLSINAFNAAQTRPRGLSRVGMTH